MSSIIISNFACKFSVNLDKHILNQTLLFDADIVQYLASNRQMWASQNVNRSWLFRPKHTRIYGHVTSMSHNEGTVTRLTSHDVCIMSIDGHVCLSGNRRLSITLTSCLKQTSDCQFWLSDRRSDRRTDAGTQAGKHDRQASRQKDRDAQKTIDSEIDEFWIRVLSWDKLFPLSHSNFHPDLVANGRNGSKGPKRITKVPIYGNVTHDISSQNKMYHKAYKNIWICIVLYTILTPYLHIWIHQTMD
jgi:hypothetical protein